MTTRGHHGADLFAEEPSSGRSVPEDFLRTLLVTCNRELGRQIHQVLEQGIPVKLFSHLEGFPDSARLHAWLDHFQPELLLLDVSADRLQAEQIIRQIRALTPSCRVVALHLTMEPTLVVTMLRAGASDFWTLPFEPETVAAGMENLLRSIRAEQIPGSRPRGRVIAFTSAKPGAGASTLAVQTSFSLCRVTGERVLLLDLNLDSGASSAWLETQDNDISSEQLLCSPCLVSDPRQWEGVTTCLHGVDFVPAPWAASDAPVESQQLEAVLESARRAYEYVVLDLPAAAHPTALAALALADEAMLVTTPDLTSLHLTRRSQEVFSAAGLSRQHVRCIVNRTREQIGVAADYLQLSLKTPVEICLPNDYFSLHAAGTTGYPLVGDGKLAQGFRRLARQISDRRQTAHLPAPADVYERATVSV